MNDLGLSEGHELTITNGDFTLLNEESKVAKQSLKINLLLFKGEWFLDNTIGVPYFQDIFKKISDSSVVDNIIQEIAENSYNITKVVELKSSITDQREYLVDALKCTTKSGEIISITNIQR